MNDRYHQRRERLRRAFAKSKADALLVTDFLNVTYLTGFTGDDSFLLVRPDGELLLSDGRYTTQIKDECPEIEVRIRRTGVNILDATARLVRSTGVRCLAIEGDSMTVAMCEKLVSLAPKLQTVTTSGLVERLRRIKDKGEIAEIRKAVEYAEKAFAVVRASLRPDWTEKQLADELEHQMRLFGAKTSAFASIVAVGARAALPHARPGQRTLGSAEVILIDWGADSGLYRSDLTRVLLPDRISPKLQRVYRVVLKAQLAGIAAIRPGVACTAVDRAARRVIEKAGYGRYFGHGLGHGVGLQIHEAPRLAPKYPGTLRPGMVVTVEPGIYFPGWGGVRIEDDILVTRHGHEVLTSAPKRLEEMVIR
jgi:Xaa-Pro aminopeptidase